MLGRMIVERRSKGRTDAMDGRMMKGPVIGRTDKGTRQEEGLGDATCERSGNWKGEKIDR